MSANTGECSVCEALGKPESVMSRLGCVGSAFTARIKATLRPTTNKRIRAKRTLLQGNHFGTFSPVTPFRYNHKFAR